MKRTVLSLLAMFFLLVSTYSQSIHSFLYINPVSISATVFNKEVYFGGQFGLGTLLSFPNDSISAGVDLGFDYTNYLFPSIGAYFSPGIFIKSEKYMYGALLPVVRVDSNMYGQTLTLFPDYPGIDFITLSSFGDIWLGERLGLRFANEEIISSFSFFFAFGG